jgi:hypothetical protein
MMKLLMIAPTRRTPYNGPTEVKFELALGLEAESRR